MRNWARWMPGLQLLRDYRADWWWHDLVAGVVLTTMLVPVGIAYAVAAGLPGIYGLYATIVPLLVYAWFGPSRFLVIGPDSSLAPIILAVVAPLAAGDPQQAVALAGAMAVVTGLFCLLLGLLRFGFVTELLSKPIRYGFMNGIALSVLIGQLPTLFGFETDGSHPLGQLRALLLALAHDRLNPIATAIGIGTLLLILWLKRFPRLPGILLSVVAATLVVWLFDLGATASVEVLGALPQGLPTFALPLISIDQLSKVVVAGCFVALVAVADTSLLSRSYAAKLHMQVDPDQELVGLGAANLVAGFFQGFPICSSASRTPVAEAAGARSQLTCVVAALAVALLLLTPELLRHLPSAALAAVVVASAIGLFEFSDLRRLHRIQPWEFWLSISCFAGVFLFGVIEGIGFAIAVAVFEFLWDGWRPHYAVLGRADGVRGYHDLKRYPDARLVPGLVLFRWDAPLFFANAEQFRRCVLEAAAQSPTPVQRVVIAAEPITSIDVTSGDMLAELQQKLAEEGVELCFAEMKDPVQDKLKKFELFERFGADRFQPTLNAAVEAHLQAHGIEWHKHLH